MTPKGQRLVILVDRSRHLLGLQKCPRARWYQYHARGVGLVRPTTTLPLLLGTSIHEVLAEVLKGEDLDAAVNRAKQNYQNQLTATGVHILPYQLDEQIALLEGLCRAWVRLVMPGLLQANTILAVEQDFNFEQDGITVMTRPDFVTKGKLLGNITIHDFKSVGVANDRWAQEYTHSLQLMLGRRAYETATGNTVNGFKIHGLVKGYGKPAWNTNSSTYDGPVEQQSILCYAYRSIGQAPLTSDDWKPKMFYWVNGKRKKLSNSYTKTPTNYYPGGVSAWVEYVQANHPELFSELVPTTSTFEISRDLEASAINSLVAYEKDWATKLNRISNGDLLDMHIPRSYNCDDFFGGSCQYKTPCLTNVPDQSLVRRIPHHKLEMDHLAGTAKP